MQDVASSLGHIPGEKWEFDESVTHVFDDMLERSIPQYAEMRRLVFEVGSRFVQRNTDIVDLGCSRGEALVPFMDRFGAYNRYTGIDVSGPMLEAARARFASWPDSIVRIQHMDLRESYPAVDASLVLSTLTLMFTPINYRQSIVQAVYDHLRPGGALILVEKLIGETAITDRMMVDRYHAMKAANGYTPDEIERKRLALEGVQVPITARWNQELLHAAGFTAVECFWRWMNFAAWVAVKRAD